MTPPQHHSSLAHPNLPPGGLLPLPSPCPPLSLGALWLSALPAVLSVPA